MNCKNCALNLLPENDFCSQCGAKVIRNRITFKQILHDFGEQFFNYDNRFLRTFIKLFTDPKDVIDGYLNGTRKKYVNVISYFAIAITVSGLQIFFLNKFFPEVMDMSAISAGGSEEFSNETMKFINEYQSLIMMLYVPLYALLARLVFLKKKNFNFTELVVIFGYILSQISIISAVVTIIFGIFGLTLGYMSIILFPVQIIYSAYCLKKLYNLSIKGIILRTLLFFVILGVLFVALSIVMGVIMMNNDSFKELIDTQRAAKEGVSYIASSAINWTS